MAHFNRPVRADALLASPEMSLRYPDEREPRVGEAIDEGVGNGFDLGSPRAYVERWFSTSDSSTAVHRWFEAALGHLGWTSIPGRRLTFQRYTRDADEAIGVYTATEAVRIHYEVEGQWPDGSSDYRPQ